MLRTKLLSASIVVSMLVPTLASARVIDTGSTPPPSAREVSDTERAIQANASSSSAGVDVGTDDVNFSDLQPIMADGKGGGMDASYMMPPYYGNGISIDVSTTKTVTPDKISLTASCDAGMTSARNNIRDTLKKMYAAIKKAIGSDGKVRRSGGYSIYPSYDQFGRATDQYMGNLNIWVDVVNFSASDHIAEILEDAGCSVSWNVSLQDMQEVEYSVLDNLLVRLNKRRDVFEKLLKTQLTKVVGASLTSWIDSWSSYDPDTNTATATITLTVGFASNDQK